MEKLSEILGMLFLLSLLWIGGFIWHRFPTNDHAIQINSKLVILFGIIPGKQPLYMRGIIIQIMTFVTACMGTVAILRYGPIIGRKIWPWCLLVNTVIGGVIAMLVDKWLQK